MATRSSTVYVCDHKHADGTSCGTEHEQGRIPDKYPMYELQLTLTAITATGAKTLVIQDMHMCSWDLFSELAAAHNVAKAFQEGGCKIADDA